MINSALLIKNVNFSSARPGLGHMYLSPPTIWHPYSPPPPALISSQRRPNKSSPGILRYEKIKGYEIHQFIISFLTLKRKTLKAGQCGDYVRTANCLDAQCVGGTQNLTAFKPLLRSMHIIPMRGTIFVYSSHLLRTVEAAMSKFFNIQSCR